MRAQPRWILAALLVLAGAVIFLLRKLGPTEVSAAPALPSNEPEVSRSDAQPALQTPPLELAREIAPESVEDDLDSYPESVESPSIGQATLVVNLLGDGRPVGPGVLQIEEPDGGGAQTKSVDTTTGRAQFGNLRAGWWFIHLYHLPQGWLPPRTASPAGADGARFVQFEIRAGANQCDIVLEPAVRVFGRVLGPDGEHLENLRVRFSPFDQGDAGNSGNPVDAGARTPEAPVEFGVDSGRYEGELHPGVWVAEVPWFGERKDARGRELPLAIFAPPLAQVRTLQAGPAIEIDFSCERGPGMIAGRIVDETGGPFQDLRVLATRATMTAVPDSARQIGWFQRMSLALTEADGTFEFRGLATGKYFVSLDAGPYQAVARPGVNAVGEPLAPTSVEIGPDGGSPRVEIRVHRSHPIHVHGRFEVDPALEKEDGRVKEPRAACVQTRVPGETRVMVSNIDTPGWQFDFYVEAASLDPLLVITYDGTMSRYPLTLSPETEAKPLVLRFPK